MSSANEAILKYPLTCKKKGLLCIIKLNFLRIGFQTVQNTYKHFKLRLNNDLSSNKKMKLLSANLRTFCELLRLFFVSLSNNDPIIETVLRIVLRIKITDK
ncbi:hypothetical protein V1477_020581 [Vespula maculifrons]|uniref:Uncharacterized protein n=1 Tax=Vespula maculifrons TaxID=7453 RepID=A0ABD2AMX3_VESMC